MQLLDGLTEVECPSPAKSRFATSLRQCAPAIQVALALYWETLVDSHTGQAQQFIGEFAHRVSATQALELYCAVVPVPGEMQEAVWTRTLATLDLDSLSAQTPLPTLSGMRWLRLDLILKLAPVPAQLQ